MASVLTVPVQKTVSSSLLQGATPLPSSIGSSSQVKTQRTSNIPTSVQNRSGTNTHISSSNNMKRVPFGRIAESDTPIKVRILFEALINIIEQLLILLAFAARMAENICHFSRPIDPIDQAHCIHWGKLQRERNHLQ